MSRKDALVRLCKYGFPSRRSTSPLVLFYNVTTRCNMQCRHCGDDVWGDPANDLPFPVIEQLSRDLGPLHEVALGGGEPFLRSDLPEICALFVRNNAVRNLCIPTNGFATGLICDKVREILARCRDVNVSLVLSLDGFQATHDNIRMPGSFDRVMETAGRLAELRTAHANFSFFFNATISGLNWRELPELARFVREKFAANLDFNMLTGTPRDSAVQLPALVDLEKTVDQIYAARDNTPAQDNWFRVYKEINLRTNVEKRQVIPCRAGSLIALIDANGDVRACAQLPPLGNLRDQSIREIWSSAKARQQHQAIIRGGCACNNDCYIIYSLNYYWKAPLLMLKQRFKR